MKLNVYAFGSALVDIQMQVQDRFFTELGIDKGNMYLTEPARQEEVLKKLVGSDTLELDRVGDKLETAAGGSAANTVFGVAQLGGKSGLCGKVGRDTLGGLYSKHMQDSGVAFNNNPVDGITGSCVVLISADAQRTMLTHLGVSSEIAYDDIDEDLLRNSSYLYLEGYLFDSPLATDTMFKAIEVAEKEGVKIAFTASDAFCIDRHKETFLKILQNDADLLFANAQEAEALTGASGLENALKALASMCPNAAVTDGGNGSVLQFEGQTERIAPCTVTPLDTTGAGDSYAAGLLYGLTNGLSLEKSGQLASLFSSRVVAHLGPRFTGDIQQVLKQMEE